MFQINLVPEIQQQKEKKARRNLYTIFSSIFIVVVSVTALVILGAIRVTQDARLKNVNSQIEQVKKESEQYGELEKTILSLESGLNSARAILDGSNSWTRLFPHLEAATPTDVAYKKIEIGGDTIKAELDGSSIESLARFVKSYQNYRVIFLSGSAEPGSDVKITADGTVLAEARANSKGEWVRTINLTPETSREMIVLINGKEVKISYNPEREEISSEDPGIGVSIINLFENIITTAYRKGGQEGLVEFSATFNFKKEALW